MNCLFCKIVNGDIPSYKIYEDDKVLAFLDINPDSIGHTLIIPKEHYLDIDTIPNELFPHIIEVTRNLKKLLYDKLNCDGLTLIQNNGDIQEVKHFHLKMSNIRYFTHITAKCIYFSYNYTFSRSTNMWITWHHSNFINRSCNK